MAFRFELTTSATPEAVLDAITAESRAWWGDAVPAELKARGVLRIDARVRPPQFRLRYTRGLGGPRYDVLELRGAVTPMPPVAPGSSGGSGGTRVTGRCGRDAGTVSNLLLLGVLLVLVWRSADYGGALIVLALGVCVAIARAVGDHAVSRGSDIEARALIEWLERVVAQTAAARAAAATTGGAAAGAATPAAAS